MRPQPLSLTISDYPPFHFLFGNFCSPNFLLIISIPQFMTSCIPNFPHSILKLWSYIFTILQSWQGPPCYDTVLVSSDQTLDGMRGLEIAHIWQFYSFTFKGVKYPCALISWYDHVADEPDEDMRMWIVSPVPDSFTVIHLDAILRCSHLIQVFRSSYVDRWLKLTPHDSLDAFRSFYINKYADYHTHEIVVWFLSLCTSHWFLEHFLLILFTWLCLILLDFAW